MEKYDFNRPIHYTTSVFIVRGGCVLLLKQERSPFWLLPGGHVEDHELPHEAAVREVLEETGLRIELLEKADEASRTNIAVPLPSPNHVLLLQCRDKKDYNLVFTARVIGGELKVDSESQEAKWFSMEELIADERVGPNTRYHALKILKENPGL